MQLLSTLWRSLSIIVNDPFSTQLLPPNKSSINPPHIIVRPYIFLCTLRPVFFNMVHVLILHKSAAYGEECRVDRSPGNEDAKVQTQPVVEVKEQRSRGLDDVVKRPGVTPVIEVRFNLDRVETRRDIGDDPEDQPQTGPGLSSDHGDVLTCQTEGHHADVVEGPEGEEGCGAVLDWVEVAHASDGDLSVA